MPDPSGLPDVLGLQLAMAPAANPPGTSKKQLALRILQSLAPMIAAGGAAATGRSGSSGSFAAGQLMSGFTRRMREKEEMGRQDIVRGDVLAERDRQFALQEARYFDEQEQKAALSRVKAAEFRFNAIQKLAEIDDPVVFTQAAQQLDDIGREMFGFEEGTVKNSATYNDKRRLQKEQQQAEDLVTFTDGRFAGGASEAYQVNPTVTFRDGSGRTMKYRDLLSLANLQMRDEAGQDIVPQPKPAATAGTEKERAAQLLGRIRTAQARNDTETATRLQQEYQELLRASRELGQADDRPRVQDPIAAELAQIRLDEARRRQTERPELPPASQRRVNQLADAFRSDPIVKRAGTMAEGYTFALNIPDATQNPADDIGLLYAFAKVMDPESVVREGEYATVQKYAQSWAQTFGFTAKRVFSNEKFLTTEAVRNMKATIQKRYRASRTGYDNVRKEFARQIDKVTGQGDGASYLVDYAAAFPPTEEKTTTAPAVGAPGSKYTEPKPLKGGR